MLGKSSSVFDVYHMGFRWESRRVFPASPGIASAEKNFGPWHFWSSSLESRRWNSPQSEAISLSQRLHEFFPRQEQDWSTIKYKIQTQAKKKRSCQ